MLYQMILRKKEWKATPTIGFNYEELTNDRGDKAGFWDIGGSDTVILLLIHFIVIYAIGFCLLEYTLLCFHLCRQCR